MMPSKLPGDYGERVPPVPIPNTAVKPLSADNTRLATAREDRTSPDSKETEPDGKPHRVLFLLFRG